MKYEKAKVIIIGNPAKWKEEKINKTINEGIKNGWQPINISSSEAKHDRHLYILMGKPE